MTSTKFQIVFPKDTLKNGWNNTASVANKKPIPSLRFLKKSYERYTNAAVAANLTKV